MDTAAKIDRFTRLQAGWHYGEGGPCAPQACTMAQHLAARAQRAGLATDAFPGLDGGVLLMIYGPEGEDAVRCETDGTLSWTREGQESHEGDGLSLEALLGLLGWA